MEIFLFLALIVFVPGICYGAWKLFLLFFFPDAYRMTKEHEHEREMSKRATNRQALGLFGSVMNLFK